MDEVWISNDEFELFTDSAGDKSKGCGIYWQGKWCVLNWLEQSSEILRYNLFGNYFNCSCSYVVGKFVS